MRNGSEVRDPLVTYEGSNPPASPLQGDLNQQGRKDKACGSLAVSLHLLPHPQLLTPKLTLPVCSRSLLPNCPCLYRQPGYRPAQL